MKDIRDKLVTKIDDNSYELFSDHKFPIKVIENDPEDSIEITTKSLLKLVQKIHRYENLIETLGINETGMLEDETDLSSVIASMSIPVAAKIFRDMELYYRAQDIESHFEYIYNEDELVEFDYGQAEFNDMAEKLIKDYDSDLALNDQIDNTIRLYIDSDPSL